MAIKKWVCDEPRADLGSRGTQSRPGFATNPEQTWVRDEPRVEQTWVRNEPKSALGSRRTQICSRFASNPEQSRLGFAMNPVMAELMRGKGRKNDWKWWRWQEEQRKHKGEPWQEE
ncbi:hypothetical protein SLEP1_g36986 [Rubroshorea leprosula]|uniref:Uncharacterized protein n=1 Tax=Rubroshorea leprosula TaxID=152421 RepID=A0AAV5KTR1_9ROSI|nr:hypothetical protein SLEP1_g36986 [Rubroshorea leprosula]